MVVILEFLTLDHRLWIFVVFQMKKILSARLLILHLPMMKLLLADIGLCFYIFYFILFYFILFYFILFLVTNISSEKVTLQQIHQYLEMDSQDERLYEMIEKVLFLVPVDLSPFSQ